jgi:uncharacterized protein (DUF2141 family)
MGGPQDEDPPILLSSTPEKEATNSRPSDIELIFNEFIKIDNPTKQIIITPRVQTEEVQFTPSRNRLRIALNQELEENTTYVFNFQKSVQDITEGNPVDNLKLVFSTGDYIDSLTFSGKVNYVFPRQSKVIQDVLVGLYPINDTTDLFTASPYYIAQADSLGNFEISNIKEGEYQAYAWHDENNSLKGEFRTEAYGFLNQPVNINGNISGVHFNLFRGDLSDLAVNRSSPVGGNYDIVLNKFPAEVEIIHPETNEKLFYRINEKIIRLYHTELKNDSTSLRLVVKDSVGFNIDTTFFASFQESERTAEKLEISANSGKGFVNNLSALLSFNKPIISINYDSLYIRYDSASNIPLNSSHLSLKDSADRTKILINIQIPDSLNFNTYTVYAADSTFMDVENEWNVSKVEANYSKIKEETLSEELSGKVETDELPLLVQLLNKNEEVIQETYLTETNVFKFTQIEAGDYKLRAIVDRNKNRRWDPGNIREKVQPEPVYYFFDAENDTYQFLMRGSWTNNGIIIHKNEESGISN